MTTTQTGLGYTYMEIPLTRGQVALVDQEDYELVSQFRWCATPTPGKNQGLISYYVHGRRRGSGERVLLHRLVMHAPAGLEVDHIDGSKTLDCRKHNLRLATSAQNSMNQRKRGRPASSKYKGVCWCRRFRPWHAHIGVNGSLLNLGRFATEEEAANCYNEAAVKYFGKFALLNVLERELVVEERPPHWIPCRKTATPTSSRHKGVCWDCQRKKWRSEIRVSGKQVFLGNFGQESDAATAYNQAATLHFGQFALLNTV